MNLYAVEAGTDGWFVMKDHPIEGEPVLSGCTEAQAREYIMRASQLTDWVDTWWGKGKESNEGSN